MLEGSKPALPGPDTVGSLFSIQFHAVEFTGVNASSQISKSHTLILHKHRLLNPWPKPWHGACSANASTRPFSPLPDGQDSLDPGYPQGIHATGIKLNHEAMNAFRKPTTWCGEKAQFMDKTSSDTPEQHQGTQQMPPQGFFSQKEAAAPSVITLQLTKIRHNSWKFQPQMPLVFAFQIVYLRYISLTHSSQAVLPASPATGAKGRQKSQPPGQERAM